MILESEMSVMALIPARGGSKGILSKNIAPIAGHPLIAWTILAAKKAKGLDRVVVSTDDETIAAVARRYGADVPFLRPTELAQDDTPGIAPPLHAVQWFADKENYRPTHLMYLQPTSPLRTSEDIDEAIQLAREKEADSVLSVTPVHHHPYVMKEVDVQGRIHHYSIPSRPMTGRQDYPPLYALNGAIWLIRHEVLLDKKDWYTDKTYAYHMPFERSLDIDTPWDLQLADFFLKSKVRSL